MSKRASGSNSVIFGPPPKKKIQAENPRWCLSHRRCLRSEMMPTERWGRVEQGEGSPRRTRKVCSTSPPSSWRAELPVCEPIYLHAGAHRGGSWGFSGANCYMICRSSQADHESARNVPSATVTVFTAWGKQQTPQIGAAPPPPRGQVSHVHWHTPAPLGCAPRFQAGFPQRGVTDVITARREGAPGRCRRPPPARNPCSPLSPDAGFQGDKITPSREPPS